jgi:hypothetical protein
MNLYVPNTIKIFSYCGEKMWIWPKNLGWSWQQSSSAGLPGIPGGEEGEGTLGIATFGSLILCISGLYETFTGLTNFVY